jgi:trimeric autotransporter adhesin
VPSGRRGAMSLGLPSQTHSMRKKSSSQSAFFNWPILIGLVVFLTGAFLALGRGGMNSRLPGTQALAQKQSGSAWQRFAPTVGPVVVTATGGDTGPTSYATVKAAFDAISAGTHQGAINIALVGDSTETVPAVLNASGAPSSYTSILIQPSGGAARTVSGVIAAGSPLIDLSGADNVTIDGLNSGGNSLTISNTRVSGSSGTSTILFTNDASNNAVTRCTVLGSSTSIITGPAGTILFDASSGTGNNNNTISFCNIGPAGTNLPTKTIMARSTGNRINTGNVITGNNIFDFFNATTSVSGISIQDKNNNWTISNNRIYQTAPRVFTGAALRYAGITLNTSSGAFTVTGNTIGFGAADGTGTTTISGSTNEFRGLDLANVSTTTPTSVQGNTISGINQTSARNATTTTLSAFTAIALGSTDGRFNVGDVTGNTIGSLDGSSTIVITATSATAGTTPIIGILDFSQRQTPSPTALLETSRSTLESRGQPSASVGSMRPLRHHS